MRRQDGGHGRRNHQPCLVVIDSQPCAREPIMTNPKKPTEESARERASQKEVVEVERAVVRGRRSPNTEIDPADAPPQGETRPGKPGQRG
jgi:hypothetical protein